MTSMIAENIPLLRVPPEIRLKLYGFLFAGQQVIVETERADTLAPGTMKLHMHAVPLSAQLLRVCKQIYQEGLVHLYSSNVFDCSQRDGIKVLLQSIGTKNFSLVRHIRIDWDELQSVSWLLAKEEYMAATTGLRSLEIAHWRTRTLGGSSFLWRQAKSYERQLCESAINICRKHPTLNIVAQRAYHRTGRAGAQPTNTRVRWRFITTADDLSTDEVVVALESDLERLTASDDGEVDKAPNLMIDPF